MGFEEEEEKEKGRGKGDCLEWTIKTRDTDWVIKWVIVRIAAFFCSDIRFEFLRFCRCKKWCHMLRLDQGHQRYRGGLKMGPSAHCRVLLHKPKSDLDS